MAEEPGHLPEKAAMACLEQHQGHKHHRRRRRPTKREVQTKHHDSTDSQEQQLSVEKADISAKLNNIECFAETPTSTIIKKDHVSEKSSSGGQFKRVNCNLDSFLDSTCPSVPVHHLPKSCQWENCRKRQQAGSAESLPYFILGDLWDRFDEWSAYGAGVPIILKGHGTVMQYYVPYLSALQLYTRSMKRQNINCRSPLDSMSEGCSATSSAAGDEDCILLSVPDCADCKCGVFNQQTGGNAGACCGCETFQQINELDSCCNSEDEHHCSSSRRGSIDNDWHRHLHFEYFESSPPYARVPVAEKIAQLVAGFPELKTLRSVDLLPASWMSIAWYPIYRIPTGPTLQDLEACFLTFHSLSTSLQDGEPSGIIKRSSRPTACAMSLSTGMQWEHSTIHLEAFGLAHYKLRGSIWTSIGNPERRHAASLYRCAESWLEKLHVGHPDFDFFRSHNPPTSGA